MLMLFGLENAETPTTAGRGCCCEEAGRHAHPGAVMHQLGVLGHESHGNRAQNHPITMVREVAADDMVVDKCLLFLDPQSIGSL